MRSCYEVKRIKQKNKWLNEWLTKSAVEKKQWLLEPWKPNNAQQESQHKVAGDKEIDFWEKELVANGQLLRNIIEDGKSWDYKMRTISRKQPKRPEELDGHYSREPLDQFPKWLHHKPIAISSPKAFLRQTKVPNKEKPTNTMGPHQPTPLRKWNTKVKCGLRIEIQEATRNCSIPERTNELKYSQKPNSTVYGKGSKRRDRSNGAT